VRPVDSVVVKGATAVQPGEYLEGDELRNDVIGFYEGEKLGCKEAKGRSK